MKYIENVQNGFLYSYCYYYLHCSGCDKLINKLNYIYQNQNSLMEKVQGYA